MKKGITPVIAVILLLLITIAMVGFAFIWFSRVLTTATNATQAQLENQLSAQAKKISIDNVNPSASPRVVSIRNIGTQTISTSEIALYIGGAPTAISCPSSLAPGTATACTWATTACNTGTRVKVTAPGNFDEVLC